jgi:hypothetical protein
MRHRLVPFVELILFSGILAGGYIIVAATTATATVSDRHNKQPTVSEAANPGSAPAPTLATQTRFSSAKPPVPLLTSRHATYWAENPEPPTTATMEGAVMEPAGKRLTSDATAKAAIEIDGYKNVRSLVQAQDGAWHGFAMRGAVEIAISVDANGRVLAE